MKIKVELTTKELAALYKNRDTEDDTAKEKIEFNFEADVTTESGRVSEEEEHLIFGSVLWCLLVMLPHGLVKQYFLAWNAVVEKLLIEMEDRRREVAPPPVDLTEVE